MDAVRFHCHYRCPALATEILNRPDLEHAALVFKQERRMIFRGRVCQS